MIDFNEASLEEILRHIVSGNIEKPVLLKPTKFIISQEQEYKYIAPMRARLMTKIARSKKFRAKMIRVLSAQTPN